MFGSGVILATALVHMLAPADRILNNPCLPTTFTEDYTSFSGAFALFAMLAVHLIQFLVSKEIRKGEGHNYHFRESELPIDNKKPVETKVKPYREIY
jgi:zinc transporter 1/2/3